MADFHLFSSLRYDPAILQVVAEHSHPTPLQSPYYLLPYHQDRLINAARHFNWHHALLFLETDQLTFKSLLDQFIPDQAKPWRLRIVVQDRPITEGGLNIEANPTTSIEPLQLLVPCDKTKDDVNGVNAATKSSPWRVFVDSQPITPSPFTTHKTTVRESYNAARQRAGITSPQQQDEVLIVNPAGEVTEGSITTPYFRRRLEGSISGGDDGSSGSGSLEWVTPPPSCGGNTGTTRRHALVQGFCTEQVIRASELVDGEECWLSNGVRGFMKGVIVLGRRAGQS